MTLNKFNLTGKTALITGAAGLLGIEHAASLLECGAKVILTDINESALDKAKNNLCSRFNSQNIYFTFMDVTSPSSIQLVADTLEKNGEKIQILINNAAIDPKVQGDKGVVEASRLENFPLNEWDLQLAVGLTGSFLCSQIFGTAMASTGKGGVIINIASDLSVFAPDQRLYRKDGIPEYLQPVKPVTYSVIKAGLIGLTRYLSTYWANKNIRCNALSPGGVYDGQSDEFVNRLSSLIPLGRMASNDEYRSAIQFLCSDASSYMNGQNLIIDGGRSAL